PLRGARAAPPRHQAGQPVGAGRPGPPDRRVLRRGPAEPVASGGRPGQHDAGAGHPFQPGARLRAGRAAVPGGRDRRGIGGHPRTHHAVPAPTVDAGAGPRPARRVPAPAPRAAPADRDPALELPPVRPDDRGSRGRPARAAGDDRQPQVGWAAVRRLFLLAVACLLLAGCVRPVSSEFNQSRQPFCEYRGDPGTQMIVLMAQAVPSASQLPCIKLLPAGWSVSDLFVRNGRARFALDSDRVGLHAVRGVLEPACQVEGAGATKAPSDEPGTRGYEQIGEGRPGGGFTGTGSFPFPGGLFSNPFVFKDSEEGGGPIGDVTLALTFIPRDAVRNHVRNSTDRRAELDPPTQASSDD